MATKANLKPYDYFFIFLLFIFALFIQHTCFFNWDASWHLLGAKRILAGNASYTKNLFDDNLPMVFWFFIPAVLINQYTHINLLFLCNASVDSVIFISFLLCHFFLTGIYSQKNLLEKRILLYGMLGILLIGPGYEFAQRDSIVTAFLFPYITLIGAQLKNNPIKNRLPCIITGVFAAIGVAMNPFFGLLIGMLELQRWIYLRKMCIATPEFLSLILVFLSYLIAMNFFYHDYFTTIIPAFVLFCAVYNSGFIYLLICSCSLLFYAVSILFFLNAFHRKNPWLLSLWLASFSSWVIFLLHQKLWESHAITVFLTCNFLLLGLIADILSNKKNRERLVLGVSIATFLICGLSSLYYHLYCYRLFQDKKSNTNQLITFFNTQPKNSSLYLFSYELVNTFSFLPYTTMHYLPAGPSIWMMVHLDSPSSWAMKQQALYQKRIVSDFRNEKPDFVLVDVSKENQKLLPNFITDLEKDSGFKAEWQRYHLVKKIGSYEIYQNKKSADVILTPDR